MCKDGLPNNTQRYPRNKKYGIASGAATFVCNAFSWNTSNALWTPFQEDGKIPWNLSNYIIVNNLPVVNSHSQNRTSFYNLQIGNWTRLGLSLSVLSSGLYLVYDWKVNPYVFHTIFKSRCTRYIHTCFAVLSTARLCWTSSIDDHIMHSLVNNSFSSCVIWLVNRKW